MADVARLKAPFPAFGGKSRVAHLVWARLGDVPNFIEPFCFSAAVLLARPHTPRVETINDKDVMISNFWRSTKYDPEAVAYWADDPVCEVTLHAIHRWLVLGDEAAAFRKRMREDPDYYDVKRAGRWCAGLCEWIGGGWAVSPEAGPVNGPVGGSGERVPAVCREAANGVHAAARLPQQAPQVGGNHDHGRGVNADLPAKLPCEWEQLPAIYNEGRAIHAKRPRAHSEHGSGKGGSMPGVHANPPDGGRPQLADAYALAQGVHAGPGPSEKRPILGGGTEAGCSGPAGVIAKSGGGTCAARRAWLLDWFSRLRDRLRCVRVCCGDFLRVMDSESVTTRLGLTGIFADPPYLTHRADGSLSRAEGLYATDGGKGGLVDIRDRLLAYCLERGGDPKMRICVATYEGDGYEALLSRGWTVEAWRSQGGYANRNKANRNRGRERLFFSPHCERAAQRGLFDRLEDSDHA